MTVVFTFKRPKPTFLYDWHCPASASSVPQCSSRPMRTIPPAPFGTEVTQAGTGPFILDSYTPDEEATMVRNEDYWGDKAPLDKLIIRPIADPAARLQALRAAASRATTSSRPPTMRRSRATASSWWSGFRSTPCTWA